MLAALGALALESLVMIFATPLDLAATSAPAVWFMPVAVIIEELFSFILLVKLFQNNPDEKNFFTRALFFGVGFSVPEIFLNYSNFSTLSQEILIAYAGLFLIHTATAGLIGCGFSWKNSLSPIVGLFLFLAILAHLAFNFSVLFNLSIWLSLGLPLFIIFTSFLSLPKGLLKTSLPYEKN